MIKHFPYRKSYILVLATLLIVASTGCKHSRYREPKKPHNSYRPGKKNKWMDEKRRNMQQF